MEKDKVQVFNFGIMVVTIKVIGIKINLMVMEDIYMKMGRPMKENGKINMLKVKVNFIKKMEAYQKVNGRMIFNMEKVKKYGLMELIIKVNTKME